jgi:hypothetical protein
LKIEEVGPDNKPTRPRTPVKFITKKNNSDSTNKLLDETLRRRNIDYDYEGAPGFAEKWGPLILISLVVLLLFYWMMKRGFASYL